MSETTPPETPTTAESAPKKSFVFSATVWVQIITMIASQIPVAQQFIADNPVQVVQFLAALNMVVRFLTKGGINIVGGNTTPPAGGLMAILVMGTAVGCMGSLPSCSPSSVNSRGWPVTVRIVGPDGEVTYSPENGLAVAAQVRATK